MARDKANASHCASALARRQLESRARYESITLDRLDRVVNPVEYPLASEGEGGGLDVERRGLVLREEHVCLGTRERVVQDLGGSVSLSDRSIFL